MNIHSSPTDSPFPVADAPLTLFKVLGAIFLALGTAGAILGAGFLLFFCSF